MTQAAIVPTLLRRPPSAAANIATLAQRELRDAVASRWFVLYTLAFAALGLAISFVSAASSGASGLAGFGRTTAGLINLILLIVPLMGLTAGAGSIASARERGMLQYLLAQPVARIEVMLGTFLGLAGALLACLCLGLGTCAAILAWKGQATQPGAIIGLAGLSFVLALGMLSIGMLISTVCRKSSVAVAIAIFVWLALVFVTDLGLMAGAIALKWRIETLLAFSMCNPLQVFKMWALSVVGAPLDVLGPAGLYASEELGNRLTPLLASCMLAWCVAPFAAAVGVFSRRAVL